MFIIPSFRLDTHTLTNQLFQRWQKHCRKASHCVCEGSYRWDILAPNKVKLIYYLVSFLTPKETEPKLFMHRKLFDTCVIPFCQGFPGKFPSFDTMKQKS